MANAVKAIRSREDIGSKTGLFGSSMGGAVCMAMAGLLAVNSLVTVAAPVRICSSIEAITAIERSAKPAPPGPSLHEKNLCFDVCETLSEVRNILIFHGEADDVIPLVHAWEIYRKAGKPKKMIIQKQGDHRISRKDHQKEFIRESAAWFRAGLL